MRDTLIPTSTESCNEKSDELEPDQYSYLWDGWISKKYTRIESLRELHARFRVKPQRVLHLDSFWNPRVASELSRLLRSIPSYSRVHAIHDGFGNVVEVDKDTWHGVAVDRRWFRHDIARPITGLLEPAILPQELRGLLRDFLLFTVRGPLFRSWLSMVTGQRLTDQASLEFARYDCGDFVVPHDDCVEGRILSVNFYLDPKWNPGRGAILGFSTSSEPDQLVEPTFNSISIVPIAPGCLHWVSEFASKTMGRETISLGFYSK